MTQHPNLFGGPEPTLLPDDSAIRDALASGTPAEEVATAHPTAPVAWAVLAERQISAGEWIAAYAFARTGYHRGLDALRRSGWKGHGPVPWEHEPNRGFLRCVQALATAAQAIGEDDEAARCRQLLLDSSPAAVEALASGA